MTGSYASCKNSASISPPIISKVPKKGARKAEVWTQEEERQLWEHALQSAEINRVPWRKIEDKICKAIPRRSLMACQLHYQVYYRKLQDQFGHLYVSESSIGKSERYLC